MIVNEWICVQQWFFVTCGLEQVQRRREKSRGEKVPAVTNAWKELKRLKTEANAAMQQEEWLKESLPQLNANLDVSWNNMQTASSTKQCVKSKNRLKLLAACVGSSNSLTAVMQNNLKETTALSSRSAVRQVIFFPWCAAKRENISFALPDTLPDGIPGIFKKPQLQKA